ncbi:MAG: hypothetical protein K2M89_06385 [Clostridiales bacterium]|nr:hypothetical protein [Clostridiales bacterium]
MDYEIVIRNDTADARKSPIAGSGTAASDTTSNGGGGGDGLSLRQGAAKGLVAVNHYIKPFVDQMATQYVTTVQLRTGSQELEERMSFKMNVTQKVVSFGSSMLTGALMGSAGGPVGAVVGAVAGAVMRLATMAVDYSNKQEKLNLQRSVENVGLRYMNARAGGSVASFSGSRLKNQ